MQLPAVILYYVSLIIGQECTTDLLINWNFNNHACIKHVISKGLSVGIIAAAAIVKIPQVLKILSSMSVKGLSVSALVLESLAYAISLAYNVRAENPFSTFGEIVFILVQNFILLLLLLIIGRRLGLLAILVPALLYITYALHVTAIVDKHMLEILQGSTIPIFVASRLPQIVSNWRNGNTGQLSALTCFLIFVGSLSRVYTTLQEVNDELILTGFVISVVLNGIIFFQILYYWNVPSVKPVKVKKN